MHYGDSAIAYWTGFFSAGSTGVLLLKVDWAFLPIEIGVKIFIAIVIAFLGGIAGVAGKDIYNSRLKKYIVKEDKTKKEE
ncbi:hypothetical protein FPE01S_02_09130 [Flavihumibacter petaseus NBRC 106054]|uniref:Uncharacterized protein n=2 Tax=Flavihumibacter TaxID=1004301 RepID=A0A0E9N1A1_9BACT|nr:hypothetical protein FPE01S_02_09130 [Flavihumibacter petaseus NBRC 106054]